MQMNRAARVIDVTELATVQATVYIIVIICLCCCFVIGPIVLCFFMGYACFAAGAGAGASNQNNQNNMEMQNRAQNPGAPPAYPARGPAP